MTYKYTITSEMIEPAIAAVISKYYLNLRDLAERFGSSSNEFSHLWDYWQYAKKGVEALSFGCEDAVHAHLAVHNELRNFAGMVEKLRKDFP
jgi:hypothetical protein